MIQIICVCVTQMVFMISTWITIKMHVNSMREEWLQWKWRVNYRQILLCKGSQTRSKNNCTTSRKTFDPVHLLHCTNLSDWCDMLWAFSTLCAVTSGCVIVLSVSPAHLLTSIYLKNPMIFIWFMVFDLIVFFNILADYIQHTHTHTLL